MRLELRRRTLFYNLNYVLPCFIVSILCLLGYILPAESGQKLPIEISTLLAIVYFSQNITNIVPASSQSIPRISKIFIKLENTGSIRLNFTFNWFEK